MEEKRIDLIEMATRERAKRFYYNNPQIKSVKLISKETDEIITCECGNSSFKFYKALGGIVLGKRNKVVKDVPVTHNYFCKCGIRILLTEDTFKFAKIKYGCSAGKCPFKKTKMDKECISCKYIYEK
jgi:hypothetical protein